MYNQDRKKKYRVEHTGLMKIVNSLDKHFNETSKSSRRRGLIKENMSDNWYKDISNTLVDIEDSTKRINDIISGLNSNLFSSLPNILRGLALQYGGDSNIDFQKLDVKANYKPIIATNMTGFNYTFDVEITFIVPNIIPPKSFYIDSTDYDSVFKNEISQDLDTLMSTIDKVFNFKTFWDVDLLGDWKKLNETDIQITIKCSI